MDIHAARSLRAGHSEEKVRAILSYADHPAFDAAERAALAYAEGMTKTPVDVSDETFEALRAHYDEPAIVEISLFVGIQNFNAKSNAALRVDINQVCPIEVPGGKWE